MSRQFEFADSEISQIRPTPDGCTITFSAALISEIQNGQTSRSFSNGLRLVLDQANGLTTSDQGFGLLASGMLSLGSQQYRALPVPSHFQTETMALHLQFANGLHMQLACQSLRCEASEQARQVEVLAC